jgi:hypothetical protein
MSVTPTDETLIVSLDFEGLFDSMPHSYDSDHVQSTDNIVGVDSIERSFQEDTLLVLFNTAISNLVRDILPPLSSFLQAIGPFPQQLCL